MSAPKWVHREMENWDCSYYALWLSEAEEYVIDEGEGYQAQHNLWGNDRKLGPVRKTLQAALNDCGRDIRKRRAQLVQAGRAKLRA